MKEKDKKPESLQKGFVLVERKFVLRYHVKNLAELNIESRKNTKERKKERNSQPGGEKC